MMGVKLLTYHPSINFIHSFELRMVEYGLHYLYSYLKENNISSKLQINFIALMSLSRRTIVSRLHYQLYL